MTYVVVFWVFFTVLFLFLEGFFSGSEMAFISLDPIKARSDEKLMFFVKHPEKLLITTLFGTNLCVVANSSFFTYMAKRYFGVNNELLTVVVLSPLILIFGETIPKSIAKTIPYRFSKRVVGLFSIAYFIFSPVVEVFSRIFRLLGYGEYTREVHISREDISSLMEEETLTSEIEEEEKELIQNLIALRGIKAREIMKPIVYVASLEERDSVLKAVVLARDTGYTRFPVYKEHIYNITGILNVFSLIDAELGESISSYVQPAYFVPEYKDAWQILIEMQENRLSLCVVVDEYGAALGLITIEDILEEVVGEIEDEYDLFSYRGDKLIRVSKNEYIVSGDLEIDLLEEELGIKFPREEVYETVGGLVLYYAGRIPREGEEFIINNVAFVIEAR